MARRENVASRIFPVKKERGETGASTASSVMAIKNWKEYALNVNDGKDNGLIIR